MGIGSLKGSKILLGNGKFKKDNEEFDNIWMDKLIVTQGEDGCRYQKELLPAFKVREVQDLSGAGDTFLAAFAVNVMQCKSVSRALDFANKCASRVVTKRGVTTV